MCGTTRRSRPSCSTPRPTNLPAVPYSSPSAQVTTGRTRTAAPASCPPSSGPNTVAISRNRPRISRGHRHNRPPDQRTLARASRPIPARLDREIGPLTSYSMLERTNTDCRMSERSGGPRQTDWWRMNIDLFQSQTATSATWADFSAPGSDMPSLFLQPRLSVGRTLTERRRKSAPYGRPRSSRRRSLMP